MANLLNDGNPLTYEWLNNLVTEINTKQDKNGGGPKITIVPDHISTGGAASVQFLTGSAVINLSKNSSVSVSTIKFSHQFATNDVLVVPAINFRNNASGIIATAWVTNITESGCIIHVKRFPPINKKTSTPITINYIAIGKGKQVTT